MHKFSHKSSKYKAQRLLFSVWGFSHVVAGVQLLRRDRYTRCMRKYEIDESSAKALWLPLKVSTHESLTYNRANSSALQATAVCNVYRRLIVNDAKSVIIDTTNLSEGLPVINAMSAKMTCVVVLSINALITSVIASICGLWPVWLSFQSTFDDLYGRSPMRSI